ncbi:enoyl-CoA hydratase/isomerase family protein [Glaciimonas soli]|uniref:Enoyl-CoA hydratase/isomerase family protein n=1 Tax=Glaciimonas soli TaxID=2590999 RepID=A0A843YTT7_9BURK|nr:enoyl-CoA hydratase/isomerase family protein [Glaciimonas soli]MQR00918.1 enoyl-CoA hydratase/isomerase family protein [Glaciimonas soli]
MTYQTLLIEQQAQTATITLNRPDVRNAFNADTIAEITRAFTELSAAPEIRAIVLAANGAAFCAGGDLNWMKAMADYTPEQNRADAGQLATMLKTIYHCPKPVIARVQGDCYAGGLGLIAACDIVVAVEAAHFCLSEVRIGLIPATISPYVIKAIGESAAKRYFITAERFTAATAQRIGLVHEVVAAEALDESVDVLLKNLLAASPHAVTDAKRLVRDVAGQPLTDALIASTVEGIARSRASEQGREGVKAFLEKRKPSWLV